MSKKKTSLNKADKTMNRLNWLNRRRIVSFVWAFLVLVPVPWLLVRGFSLGWLPVLMALGPVLVGLWLFGSMRLKARKSKKSPLKANSQRKSSTEWLIKSLAVGLVLGLVAGLVVVINGNDLTGYNLVKSLGLWTYAIIGLAPVVVYASLLHGLLTQRKLSWRTMVLGLVSLIAPWIWASNLAYAINP